jgi:hypothetical protein
MSDRKYYIRRANKAIGPLSLERLKELLQQGTLQSDSIVGDSPSGPWLQLAEIIEATNPKPEPPPPPPQAENSSNGFDFPQIDFGNVSASAQSAAVSTYWDQPSSTQFKAKTSNKAKSAEPTATPIYIRAFAPWVGENERGRYGNLERYIEIYRSVSVVCFVLGFIAISASFLIFEGFSIIVLVSEMNRLTVNEGSGKTRLILMWMLQSFGFMVSYLLAFLFLHLVYIVSMAFIDFFRLMIDVEGNTREVAIYARSEANS